MKCLENFLCLLYSVFKFHRGQFCLSTFQAQSNKHRLLTWVDLVDWPPPHKITGLGPRVVKNIYFLLLSFSNKRKGFEFSERYIQLLILRKSDKPSKSDFFLYFHLQKLKVKYRTFIKKINVKRDNKSFQNIWYPSFVTYSPLTFNLHLNAFIFLWNLKYVIKKRTRK